MSADIRNQAATVILATCADSEQANLLGVALRKEGFGSPTRGNGEKGRSPPDQYQETYVTAVHGPIVIAVRSSIVKSLGKQSVTSRSDLGVYLLIAQLDFRVSIAEVLHMRVAAIVTDSAVVERGKNRCENGLAFWNDVVHELYENTVRVLVFKDSAEQFREALQKKMQHTRVSNVCGRGPSFFVLGPLDNVVFESRQQVKKFFTLDPTKEDTTKKWASISSLKLKKCNTPFEKSTRTFVFLGSEASRRSGPKHAEREKKARDRWRKRW